MALKQCTKCKEYFSATLKYFYSDKKSKDGLQYHCKFCEKIRMSKYYRENRDAILLQKREYYYDNQDIISKKHSIYNKNNRTIRNNYWKQRRLKDQDGFRFIGVLHSHKRRSRVKQFNVDFTDKDWESCLIYWNHSCAYCGSKENITLEHYIPVSDESCTGTILTNVLPACKHCNCSKNNRNAVDWLYSKYPNDVATIINNIESYFKGLL